MSRIEMAGKPMIQQSQENFRKMTKEQLAKEILKLRDRDKETVTGIFKNLENPARDGGKGSVTFGYKAYPGDQYIMYELWDGERYSLPRGVARHLNNNCFYKEYSHLSGEFGQQGIRGGFADGRLNSNNQTAGMKVAKKIHRYAFMSLEYMAEDEDFTPTNLIEVTQM